MKKLSFLLTIATLTSCYYKNEVINTCVTSNISYQADIQPILDASCVGCHSGPNAFAGISVENYDSTKPYAIDGSLYGSMNHDSGYSPMPKGGNKLDSCNLAKIKSWVDAGAPNN
jgi:hypothetical protein